MKVDTDFVMSINGEAVTTEHTQPVYNPATRSVFAQVPDASKAQLDTTVAAARQAFAGWRQTPVDERQAALERFADLLEEHAEDDLGGNHRLARIRRQHDNEVVPQGLLRCIALVFPQREAAVHGVECEAEGLGGTRPQLALSGVL